MRVRFLVPIAGPDWSAGPGEAIDISDAEAEGLVAGGLAVRADDPESVAPDAGSGPLAAALEAPERAVPRRVLPRRAR